MRLVLGFFFLIASQLALAATPKTGGAAPDFSLKGVDGQTYKLSSFKGKTVVLEWFNKDCPYVRKFYDSKTMQGLQKEYTGKGIVWLSIVSSAPGKEGALDEASGSKTVASFGMGSTALLLDPNGEVGKSYGAKTTPHMYVIDKAGNLVYQGAIDDRPSATQKSLAGAQNYVRMALNSLEKGEAIKNSSTPPYGCSVKY
ncbi:MAG: thioredoxin family protein [Bdellovibrionales bacterium]